MADIVRWPVIPRPIPVQIRLARRDPNVSVSPEDQAREKQLQMRLAREAYTHALRKLLIVAQANDETAWAIRLIETTLGEAKSEFETGDRNVDSK